MNKKKCIIVILYIILLYFVFFIDDKNINDENIIYIENFLDKKDYKKVLQLDKNKETFIYENFRYAKPLKEEYIYNIFYHKKYVDLLQGYIEPKIYPSDFPIEHRFYPDDSQGMKWHKDTLLYEKPQYEAIFTITNESESKTQWRDKNGNLQELWTKPNSILVVKAQGYEHQVTPPVIGEREILKLIYTQSKNVNENYHNEMKRFDKFNN